MLQPQSLDAQLGPHYLNQRNTRVGKWRILSAYLSSNKSAAKVVLFGLVLYRNNKSILVSEKTHVVGQKKSIPKRRLDTVGRRIDFLWRKL